MNPPITGQGVLVGIFSLDHTRVTHEAFYNKDGQGNPTGTSYATYFDAAGESAYEVSYHDTAMAGIVGSRGGKLYPAEIGVAPGCSLLSVRMVDAESHIYISYIESGLNQMVSRGGRVVVTGVQLPASVVADGTSQFSLVYDYYAQNNDMIFINAAGNDTASITVFGDSFNGITVGGLIMPETGVYRQVGTASNPGPTADARHKPDIAAPAQSLRVPVESSDTAWTIHGTTRGETSWAGPHAAGVAALLVQYAKSTTTISDDDKSAVIKAVMVNSAFPNIKNKTGAITTGQTWNAQRGYGRVDAWRAYQTLKQPKVAKNTNLSQTAGWDWRAISSNGRNIYYISGRKNQRLVLTTTWHRVVSRDSGYYSVSSTQMNLNLSIYDPQNNLKFSEANTADNLRKADILLDQEGYYRVQIDNTTGVSRYYAMAYELLEPLKADFTMDSIVDAADVTDLTDFWLATGCTNPNQACYVYDLMNNGRIDFQDMAALSAEWLNIDPRYYPIP